MKHAIRRLSSAGLFALVLTGAAWAADEPLTADVVQTHLNYVWTLVAAFLVFFMQAGFAMVEAGFTRAKNVCNILMKNFMDFGMGALAFFFVGFGLMFGLSNGWIGTSGFMLRDFAVDGDPWVYAFFMFQVVFAATAATIVSGAVAERMKFSGYLVFSALMTAIVYPVFGSWAWGSLYKGGGWLEGLGFIDFAGSTVVHSVGGWAALAGAIVVGPRIGKYKNGKPQAIPGHSIPLAALGVLILFFGWFGFNPGSTTAGDTSIALIAVTTALAGAAGLVSTIYYTWVRFGKPDVGMTLNGCLAGLVGITAGCANVSPLSAIVIGLVAGVLVTESVVLFDKVGVDDPVGAVSVHGVCGAWGTLAAGLFNSAGFSWSVVGVQVLGIAVAFVWAFGSSFVLFRILKAVMGVRLSAEEELTGCDLSEHGLSAYPEFLFPTVIGSAGSGPNDGSEARLGAAGKLASSEV
ncbi:ammonium transporter [Deferrisoma camini]|uniref:ammonium transporter n=1 Tax=Deferrisoma camini TaxID=1035120 RepID=UPI00046D82F2|nr:ammonium transporter [Deferrisoma camini]